ncbi:hypothetical protein F2Q70_00017799 [Brassica cretica]|uniref:Uncharacterized protein n=1 Tax=Brassica cretica TaxID=69181 RepID=A0A8S9L3M0_BRACR|nr:hypothetical protein F2Q70_00017799 [Brassica cretica]KAF2600537.1 hypothetical protein F2Q68_00010742 [Brassica cretica]
MTTNDDKPSDPDGKISRDTAHAKSNRPTGSDDRDRPPKKAKTIGVDHRSSLSSDSANAKLFHWQFSHAKDSHITEDPDSVAHLVRHFNPNGFLLPSLRNMKKPNTYVKMAVAHAKFAVTLEKRLQDIPRFDELHEVKKVFRELKLSMKVAQDRERANITQLAAAGNLRNQAASLKADFRWLESYEAKKALDASYLDVLVSLKEKWERKKVAANCEALLCELPCLRAKESELGAELGAELDVAVVPSEENDPGGDSGRSDAQYEDGTLARD